MLRRNLSTLCLGAFLLLAPQARAELADSEKPMLVEAGRGGLADKAGRAVLEGGVKMTQGTLSVDADQAVIQKQADGEQTVHAEGRPVKFRQRMEGQQGWLDARAAKLDYDSGSGNVKLVGNAWLKHGEDEISGSVITYNTHTEIYSAEGGPATANGETGRIKMIIQPKKKPAESPAKP
ncbi:lipopolysaccharide transport periplasmic protein LptA [Chitinimonas arctica]|uniref:Lipopolysaccharide export system protein LptA n=1 Tax=Chitinimonas arctica TaxID=2594795 RepID=A0A516SE10_9NEIS|nr:lipopolysaccharide transport periplasmic protein LptA [Chitinimonas arctica]QDQ26406.1 lipopolysaccharide transport periplasmic protein LptA [Chitinimonas arctica]